MTRDGERLTERPVERRLRQALDARADSIDVRRLRPAEPPGAHLGRLPMAGLRRFALPLAGLAAAAAAGIGYLLLAPDASPGPGLPATPPRITTPGPSPQDPTSPGPRPSGSGRPTPSVSSPPTGSVSPSVPVSPGASGSQPPSASPSGARGGIVTSSPSPSSAPR
ncbi:hypothetical protein [Streptomyces sp. DSM 40907]|uniref:hypothetical protein n=1 Tax=Streptomyces kutzneri TaxID=3051179 RepID=UPI0028D128CE|nr:hypothetical protein [Streptomyces sp. DSM 40907]